MIPHSLVYDPRIFMNPVNAEFCCVTELTLHFGFLELLLGMSLDWIKKNLFEIITAHKIAKEGLGFKVRIPRDSNLNIKS